MSIVVINSVTLYGSGNDRRTGRQKSLGLRAEIAQVGGILADFLSAARASCRLGRWLVAVSTSADRVRVAG